MRRKRVLREEELAQVNLTPLIDVVFVILIMFIVIAPLLEVDHVSLAPGPDFLDKNTPSALQEAAINIHVRQDNAVYLNKEQVGIESLSSRLMELRHLYPDTVPHLFHDKQAHFGTYQSIRNAAEKAGFSEMDLILLPPER